MWVCLGARVIALCWCSLSDRSAGSGATWDVAAASQLTTHISLRRGWDSLLTGKLWNIAYEKSKMKCFCNIMRGQTNVGVHENIQASLLTWAGGGEEGSCCVFVKQIKESPRR